MLRRVEGASGSEGEPRLAVATRATWIGLSLREAGERARLRHVAARPSAPRNGRLRHVIALRLDFRNEPGVRELSGQHPLWPDAHAPLDVDLEEPLTLTIEEKAVDVLLRLNVAGRWVGCPELE